ncbi:1-aminocyclopropane-1-carboxylate deaminase/D-cysteine desulfhydrase [Shewanella surugensis]|uniref:1-aminocyclopropane-1-carboxylate deaminase/D-cysteine desulfhydrase n=1 Tax=Shewanella surugensis TaxID=212020 RepID=A0ABT0LF90_9GAMM|nr:1-aminocyclopropane-1-carboxylate deaminase/D-cysteine desulfhydrase [Shewanella surugensis]MCL1126364.1 1-aminocyclopropane-1-carboxylate deaminase/D-cysteine desulfhydrase [Shewanella surugensis]
MKLNSTPVERIDFCGYPVFVKRDDMLHPEFSGNKARKFRFFLDNDFPYVRRLISFGSPQSNALYSLSALAKMKGWQFDYYVDHIADQVLKSTQGNFVGACINGANVINLSQVADRRERSCSAYIDDLVSKDDDSVLVIPEGGRCEYAQYGISQLGEEILIWMRAQQLNELWVFLPSGTGTTALYLASFFKKKGHSVHVMTCAAVGGSDYLKQQFSQLVSNTCFHPNVIEVPKKFHFGQLYRPFYEMWKRLNDTGIEFDLLYDPLGWIVLESYLLQNDLLQHKCQKKPSRPILYIHQGGLLGNASMLPRYQRKFG